MTTCRTYDDLIRGIREHMNAIGMSCNELDAVSGMPTGYAGKVLGPARVRALGPKSFEYFLGALGLVMKLEVDPEAEARIAARAEKLKATAKGVGRNPPRNRSLKDSLRRQAIRHGRVGGRKSHELRMAKPKEYRSEISRKGALTQWKKRKEIGTAIEKNLEKQL